MKIAYLNGAGKIETGGVRFGTFLKEQMVRSNPRYYKLHLCERSEERKKLRYYYLVISCNNAIFCFLLLVSGLFLPRLELVQQVTKTLGFILEELTRRS